MAIKRTILNSTDEHAVSTAGTTNLRQLLGQRFSEAEIDAMDRYGSLITVESGETLTVEGQVGSEAFILVAGKADVRKAGASVATVGAGEIIGEHALITETRRDADVVATEQVSMLAFTSREFGALLAACPELSSTVEGLSQERSDEQRRD